MRQRELNVRFVPKADMRRIAIAAISGFDSSSRRYDAYGDLSIPRRHSGRRLSVLSNVRFIPPMGRQQRDREIGGRTARTLARLVIRERIAIRFDRTPIQVPGRMSEQLHHHPMPAEERDPTD